MIAVFDTNVLVSALWSPSGKAAYLLGRVLAGDIRLCFDFRILSEYEEVLRRPKFRFELWQVDALLDVIERGGLSVVPPTLPDVNFVDEDDRMFYEVAKFCGAPLVTGNLKHFPVDECVCSVADFYRLITTV